MPQTPLNVSKSSVAAAYRSWLQGQPRKSGVDRSELFRDQIAALLNLSASSSSVDRLPHSRSTWSNWAKSDPKKVVQLDIDLCRAIHSVTGVEITEGQLPSGDADFTEVVQIPEQPTARLVSNQPSEDGCETYSISVPRLAFRKSSSLRVTSPSGRDIGSVVFGIRSANICISGGERVHPNLTYLTPTSSASGGASAEGVTVVDNPKSPGSWIVNGERNVLLGSLYLPDLANAEAEPNSELEITVEARNDDVEVDFVSAPGQDLTQSGKSLARKRLLDQLIRVALETKAESIVFSRSNVPL